MAKSGKKVRSAKGEMIDFDLLKIKEQIASEPAPLDVRARQDHIDARLRRRLRKVKKTGTAPAAPVAVQPKMPAAEAPETPEPMLDEVTEPVVEETPKKVTKQKARRTTKKKTTEE